MLIYCSNELGKFKSKLVVNVAINYSSKTEILKSVKMLIKDKKIFQILKNIVYGKSIQKLSYEQVLHLSDFLYGSCYLRCFLKNIPDLGIDLQNILKKFFKIKRNFIK